MAITPRLLPQPEPQTTKLSPKMQRRREKRHPEGAGTIRQPRRMWTVGKHQATSRDGAIRAARAKR